jgi:hypothetical protein
MTIRAVRSACTPRHCDAYLEGRNDSLKEIVTGGDEFVEVEETEEEAR